MGTGNQAGTKSKRALDRYQATRGRFGQSPRQVWSKRQRAFIGPGLGALLPLIILVGVVRSQPNPESRSCGDDRLTIRVSVDMVVLHATVRNRNGSLVSGLGKGDFEVSEDGVRQTIASFSHDDIPVTVGLVVDNSGSMRPKRNEVVSAAMAFARSSHPDDEMFVVSFNENVSFGLPDDMLFTDQAAQLETAMSRIAAGGRTALYDAVAASLMHLNRGTRDKRVLIVVSDGGDNASGYSLAQIMAMAGKSDAIIYTIGVFDEHDPDRNPRALRRPARATGGDAFLPGSLREILPTFQAIADDIRNQYSITYRPTNSLQDGGYRVIQVKVRSSRRDRLSVRTRAGYYAPVRPVPPPEPGAIP